ncbi:MAG: PASTA domain-containing protein [Gemmatimonadota bacterium]
MRPRRHLADSALGTATATARRLLWQLAIVMAAFGVGYLLTLIIYPAPLFTSDHSIPRLIDQPIAEAKARLEKQGFRTKLEEDEASPETPKGSVIWQDPAPGTILPKGTTVHLTASSGPSPVAVPDVVGLPVILAQRVITASGLKAGNADSVPSSADRGTVIAVRPPTGSGRDPGTPISIIVSNGPAEISVPDVIGMKSEVARARLTQAGLSTGALMGRATPNRPEGLVIEQRPSPGSMSPRGGRVDLILSRRPSP